MGAGSRYQGRGVPALFGKHHRDRLGDVSVTGVRSHFLRRRSAGSPASTNLWVFSSMVNLTLRYPGKAFVPYIGVGGGYSSGVLTHANIPGRSDRDFEGSWTFGYQFFGGLQGNLTEKVYLFSEYKYFSADYHWEQLALDFRSQYALFGIGLRF